MNHVPGQFGWLVLAARCLLAAATTLGVSLVVGPDAAQGSGQVSAEDLVHQLGAGSFRLREQAEDALRQRGVDALPILRDAADDRDLEVRFRVRRLMQSIEHQHQLRLLGRFLSDYDAELAQQLAGWSRFAELVGDDLKARQLFVAMYEAEPELMSLVDRSSPVLPFTLENRTQELRPTSSRRPNTTVVPASATAVLLFVSLDPAANASSKTKSAISQFVNESAFRRAAAATRDPPIRRLLGAWVSGAKDVHAGIRMSIANRFSLDEAVDPALELIESRVGGSSQLQQAIFTIAELGTAEQIPDLERLFDNQSVLSERQRGEDETFTCLVRDVALVAAIHLIGKHPREFGFAELKSNANSLYSLNTAGFDSAEQRAAAFRQWDLWRHVQRHESRGVDENAVEGTSL